MAAPSYFILANTPTKYNAEKLKMDCCEALGNNIIGKSMMGDSYKYITVIYKNEIDPFFHNEDNLNIYMKILANLFNFTNRIVRKEEGIIYQEDDTFDEIFYIETSIPRSQATNKWIVAYHTCLRYLWYNLYQNIPILAVNIYKIGATDDPVDILAIASSYQGNTNRALVAAVGDSDTFLYFPRKEKIHSELKRNKNFNTIFGGSKILYQPKVYVNAGFFENSNPEALNAKDLLSPLSDTTDIEYIPETIIRGVKESVYLYSRARQIVDVVDKELASHQSTLVSNLILDSESLKKNTINVMIFDSFGVPNEVKINYVIV